MREQVVVGFLRQGHAHCFLANSRRGLRDLGRVLQLGVGDRPDHGHASKTRGHGKRTPVPTMPGRWRRLGREDCRFLLQAKRQALGEPAGQHLGIPQGVTDQVVPSPGLECLVVGTQRAQRLAEFRVRKFAIHHRRDF